MRGSDPQHLPSTFGMLPQDAPPALPARETPGAINVEAGKSLNEVERSYILLTLKSTDNNKKRAAEILGIAARYTAGWPCLPRRTIKWKRHADPAQPDPRKTPPA